MGSLATHMDDPVCGWEAPPSRGSRPGPPSSSACGSDAYPSTGAKAAAPLHARPQPGVDERQQATGWLATVVVLGLDRQSVDLDDDDRPPATVT